MKIWRSMLLVPPNVQKFVDNAHDIDVDIIQFDLQDAIPKNERAKLEARQSAAAALKAGGFRARELVVRVNGPQTHWFFDDVAAVVAAGADAIRLTHANGVYDVLYAEGCVGAAARAAGRKVEIQLEHRPARHACGTGRNCALLTAHQHAVGLAG